MILPITTDTPQTLINFPDELVIKFFSYLELDDLMNCSLACWKFERISHEPLLWKNLFFRLSDGWIPEEEPESWKVLIKKVFFFELCLWKYEKAQRDCSFLEKSFFAKLFKRQKVITRLDHYKFLESPENEIYYFYSLCGDPARYYSIPESNGTDDPSPFTRNRSNVIIRKSPKVKLNYLRFYTDNEQKKNQRYGVGEVRFKPASAFSTRLNELVYSFRSRILGLYFEDHILIRNGMIENRTMYEKVIRLIDVAIDQQNHLC